MRAVTFLPALAWVLVSFNVTAEMFEPFTTANISPFTLVHGVPVTRSARIIPSGSLEWQVQTNFANSFTNSSKGTESIVIDGETHKAALSLRYGLSERWELGFEVPYISHEGGGLDSFIEDFHDLFGLPNGGRDKTPQDQINYLYQETGTALTGFSRSTDGVGDVRLNLGYVLQKREDRTWSLRGGVKLPTGDADKLTGSEGTDVYVGLHLSEGSLFSRESLYFHGNIGVLVPGDSEVISDRVEDWVAYGSSTLSWLVHPRVSLKAQVDFHSALYDSELRELGDFAAQLVLGGSVKLGEKTHLDLSVSEDIITDTSPDVVFQLGLRARF